MGPRNHVLHEGSGLPTRMGNFEGKRVAHCNVWRLSAVRCAKTAEPVEMPFGISIRVDPRKHLLRVDGVHIGATWRIRLTRPRPADVRLFCQITLTTCIHFRTVLCVPDPTFNWKTSLNLTHRHEVANRLVIAINV